MSQNGRVLSIDGLDGLDALYGMGSARQMRLAMGAAFPDGGYTVDDKNPDELQPGKDKGPVQQWPGALSPSKEFWVETPDSPTGWGYRVHTGFTLAGWSSTYMGDPARTMEVWNFQPQSIKSTYTPSNIKVGTVLHAPPDAVKKAQTLGLIPGKAGQLANKVGGWKVVVGVGLGLVVVGGGVYLATR